MWDDIEEDIAELFQKLSTREYLYLEPAEVAEEGLSWHSTGAHRQRTWREANREKARALGAESKKKWRQKNPERAREQNREAQRRRRARLRESAK